MALAKHQRQTFTKTHFFIIGLPHRLGSSVYFSFLDYFLPSVRQSCMNVMDA